MRLRYSEAQTGKQPLGYRHLVPNGAKNKRQSDVPSNPKTGHHYQHEVSVPELLFEDLGPQNPREGNRRMTWIKTVSPEDDEKVREAVDAQRELYPSEYAVPIHPTADQQTSEIVASHSLIPNALHHAFATFGALMSPDLPLTRRQHEMITTVVSVANRCHY